ncbi:MAG TPA: M23 family metallopeptidase [Longimicrobiales bacterium]
MYNVLTERPNPIDMYATLLLFAASALAAALHQAETVGSDRAAAPPSLERSFDLFVPHPPRPVPIDGAMHLVYELHLTNFADRDLALARIDVIDPDGGAPPIAVFEDSALVRRLGRPGLPDTADPRVVAPGMRAIAYFWIPLPPGRRPPVTLAHRIAFRAADGADGGALVEGGRVAIQPRPPGRPLGPPLRGGPWVAVYDPGLERGHRRVLFAHDGRARIPARFAIDWMKVDEDGRLARDDTALPADHYGYGAEVLAVADAIVAAVRGSLPDRTAIAHVRLGLANASGNHITLDLGDGRFVSYEHLMAGSIRVAVGDRVRRGQAIARLGYSGEATSPHLHVHVSDGPDPLAGEGVPYVFEEFTRLGAYPSLAAFAAGGPWDRRLYGLRTFELPAPNIVVDFGWGPRHR